MTTLTQQDVSVQYPQCYLYTQKESDFVANKALIEIALFGSGASLQSANQAAIVIASIVPGYIVSRAEYEAIQKVLKEIS